MEDYCMAIEHSVEFQVIFLQYLFGAEITVLPVLCGAFAKSLYLGEVCPSVTQTLPASLMPWASLAHEKARSSYFLRQASTWHTWAVAITINSRHRTNVGQMAVVAARDRARIDSINAGDARGFGDEVKENHDDLKWCGSPPFYTSSKTMPQARGTLENYEQWNIDPQSVVSFAAMKFR